MKPQQTIPNVGGEDEDEDVASDTTPLLKHPGQEDESESRRRSLLLRARVLTIILPMLMGSAVQSRETLVAQYIVARFEEEYNTTSASNDCANSTVDPDQPDPEAATADLLARFALVMAIPSLLACLVFGSYSDFLGRRKLLLIPLTTSWIKIAATGLIIWLHLDLNWFYPAYLIDGLAGSWFTILIAIYAITADINHGRTNRTLSIFAVLGGTSISQAGVSVAVGELISYVGFSYAGLLIIIIMALSVLLALFCLPETLNLNPSKVRHSSLSSSIQAHENSIKEKDLQQPQRSWVHPGQHLRRMFGFYLFEGTRRRRAEMTVVLLIFMFPVANEINLPSMDSLYQLHQPFCWDSREIGYYNAIRIGGSNLLGGLWLFSLQRCVPFEVLGALGVTFQGAALTFEAFIKTSNLFYVVPVLLMPSVPISAIARSILSLKASADLQGAVFSSVAVVECLIAVISTVLYDKVFSLTTDSAVPGAVYLLMASWSLIAVILYFVYFAIREPITADVKHEADAENTSAPVSS